MLESWCRRKEKPQKLVGSLAVALKKNNKPKQKKKAMLTAILPLFSSSKYKT